MLASILFDAAAAVGCLVFLAAGGVALLVAVALNSKVGREAAAGFFARKAPPPNP